MEALLMRMHMKPPPTLVRVLVKNVAGDVPSTVIDLEFVCERPAGVKMRKKGNTKVLTMEAAMPQEGALTFHLTVRRSYVLPTPATLASAEFSQWYQMNPDTFHFETLATLHSLPFPVMRHSQKFYEPAFFSALHGTHEAERVRVWLDAGDPGTVT